MLLGQIYSVHIMGYCFIWLQASTRESLYGIVLHYVHTNIVPLYLQIVCIYQIQIQFETSFDV